MKRRSFFQLLLALAGLPFLPKAASKAVVVSNPVELPGPSAIPVGSISMHHGVIPAGWLPCDGRTLGRPDYPELWEAIGGADTFFELPNLDANVFSPWRQQHEANSCWLQHEENSCLGWHAEPVQYSGLQYIIRAKP